MVNVKYTLTLRRSVEAPGKSYVNTICCLRPVEHTVIISTIPGDASMSLVSLLQGQRELFARVFAVAEDTIIQGYLLDERLSTTNQPDNNIKPCGEERATNG